MTSLGNGTCHATQEQHIQIQEDYTTVSIITGLTGYNKYLSGVAREVLPPLPPPLIRYNLAGCLGTKLYLALAYYGRKSTTCH